MASTSHADGADARHIAQLIRELDKALEAQVTLSPELMAKPQTPAYTFIMRAQAYLLANERILPPEPVRRESPPEAVERRPSAAPVSWPEPFQPRPSQPPAMAVPPAVEAPRPTSRSDVPAEPPGKGDGPLPATLQEPTPVARATGVDSPEEELFVQKNLADAIPTEAPSSDPPKPPAQTDQPYAPPPSATPGAPCPQAPSPRPTVSLKLKPGTVGAAYASQVMVPDRPAAKAYAASGLEPLGLTLDPATGALTGVPTTSGEHRFEVTAQIVSSTGADADVTLVCDLLINPDPRSLWKTIEPAADALHRQPHEATIRLADGDFLIIGASKRGRSHAHEGKFREDAMGAAVVAPGWHAAVVCDGAGSASLSRLGSEVAVATCLARLRQTLAQADEPGFQAAVAALAADRQDAAAKNTLATLLYTTLIDAGHEAAKAVEQAAEAAGVAVRELASTLVMVLARRTPAGVFVGGFSIGDGGAGLLRLEPLYVKPLTHPDSGEYAGQTRFLARAEFNTSVSERLRLDIQPDFDAIVLMSDGVTDPKLPTESALADPVQWRALWDDLTAGVDFSRDNPRAEQQLLDWLDFWSPGNHDDRTITVIRP